MMEVETAETVNQAGSQHGTVKDRLPIDGAQQEGEMMKVEVGGDSQGNGLPSINEELARIFPDSAHKFLKPVKKRGRPRKYPKVEVQKTTHRGRGRPRKTDSTKPSSVMPAVKKGHGKVGRPRKISTLERHYDYPVTSSALEDTERDNGKRQWTFDSSIEMHQLRKKPRLCYVEAYVDDDIDEYDEESEDAHSDASLGNSHSEPGSYMDPESGFESDSPSRVEMKKQEPKKKNLLPEEEIPEYRIIKKSPGKDLSGYQKLKMRLLKFQVAKGKGRPTSKLKIAGPKRGRGRPRKNEIQNRVLKVRLERLTDLGVDLRDQNASYMVKDLKTEGQAYLLSQFGSLKRKRGRPKKTTVDPSTEHDGEMSTSQNCDLSADAVTTPDVKMTNVRVRIERLKDDIHWNSHPYTKKLITNQNIEEMPNRKATENRYELDGKSCSSSNQEDGVLTNTQSYYLSQEVLSPMLTPKRRGRPKRQDSVTKYRGRRGRPCKADTMPKRPRGRPRKFPKISHGMLSEQTKADSYSPVIVEVRSLGNPDNPQMSVQINPLPSQDVTSTVSTEVDCPTRREENTPVETPAVSPDGQVEANRGRGRPIGSFKKKKWKGRPRAVLEESKLPAMKSSGRPRGRPKGSKKVLNVSEKNAGANIGNSGQELNIEVEKPESSLNENTNSCLADKETDGVELQSKTNEDLYLLSSESSSEGPDLKENFVPDQGSSENCEMRASGNEISDLDVPVVKAEMLVPSGSSGIVYSDMDSEKLQTVEINQSVSQPLPVVNSSHTDCAKHSNQSDMKSCDVQDLTKCKQTESENTEQNVSERETGFIYQPERCELQPDSESLKLEPEAESSLDVLNPLSEDSFSVTESWSITRSERISKQADEIVAKKEFLSNADLETSELLLGTVILSGSKAIDLIDQAVALSPTSKTLAEVIQSEDCVSDEKSPSRQQYSSNMTGNALKIESKTCSLVSESDDGTGRSLNSDSHYDTVNNQSGESSSSLLDKEKTDEPDCPDDNYLLSF